MTTITISENLIKNNDLIIIPRREYEELLDFKKVISKNQAWFWTKEWQKKEREANEDIKKGKYKEFKNVKYLLKDLHS